MNRISLTQQEDYLLKIGILKEAKRIFNPAKHGGICGAIWEASESSSSNPILDAGDYLCDYISSELGVWAYLDAYLFYEKGKRYKYQGKIITKIRKAWLQWMIDSYEERLK